MAYATVDELAQALHVTVTAANTDMLTACLEAAADEIDGYLDVAATSVWPPAPVPASIQRCNVNRAVEWVKATDAAFGALGFDQMSQPVPPGGSFARHGSTIRRYRQQWGVS